MGKIIVLAALLLATLTLATAVHERAHAVMAACSTDTDCMRLCPVDDTQCDGGPQS